MGDDTVGVLARLDRVAVGKGLAVAVTMRVGTGVGVGVAVAVSVGVTMGAGVSGSAEAWQASNMVPSRTTARTTGVGNRAIMASATSPPG